MTELSAETELTPLNFSVTINQGLVNTRSQAADSPTIFSAAIRPDARSGDRCARLYRHPVTFQQFFSTRLTNDTKIPSDRTCINIKL